jgi:hypothetical protein
LSFLKLGLESGGSVSKQLSPNPSKSALLYASLLINDVPLQTLIDTGASATCISEHALSRLLHVRYVNRMPRSFLLADGFVPLRVCGNVALSMQIANEHISFSALVTEKLCVDLILGIDFLSFVGANINVEFRQFSLNRHDRRLTINVDETLPHPIVPIWSVSSVILPPNSRVDIFVSSPVSSLSSVFIPAATFCEHPHLSTTQKNVIIEHHVSSLSVINHSTSSQTIPQNYCFGYLHRPPLQKTFFDRISDLCKRYNEKRNQQLRSLTLFTHQVPQHLPNAISPPNPALLPQHSAAFTMAFTSSPSPLTSDLDELVHKLDNPKQRTQVSSLLLSQIFSILLNTTSLRLSSISSLTPILILHHPFGHIAILIIGKKHKRLLMNFLMLRLFTNQLLFMRLRLL